MLRLPVVITIRGGFARGDETTNTATVTVADENVRDPVRANNKDSATTRG